MFLHAIGHLKFKLERSRPLRAQSSFWPRWVIQYFSIFDLVELFSIFYGKIESVLRNVIFVALVKNIIQATQLTISLNLKTIFCRFPFLRHQRAALLAIAFFICFAEGFADVLKKFKHDIFSSSKLLLGISQLVIFARPIKRIFRSLLTKETLK